MFGIETAQAFANVPAVIAAFDDEVDFLPRVLAHVGGEEFMRAAAIERNAPRVAQAPGENLRAHSGVRVRERGHLAVAKSVVAEIGDFAGGEGIVRRDRVRIAFIHVDAGILPSNLEVLGVAWGDVGPESFAAPPSPTPM